MKPLAIIYGSSGDNTKNAARKIAESFAGEQVTLYDVASLKKEELESYDNLILGTSTWGIGDLQDDWEGFLPELKVADLEGKTIALFGLGDSSSYSDSFVDGMGILYETVKDKGCELIGFVSTDNYDYDASRADIGGMFAGLALDEDNEYDQTDDRISAWVEDLKRKFN